MRSGIYWLKAPKRINKPSRLFQKNSNRYVKKWNMNKNWCDLKWVMGFIISIHCQTFLIFLENDQKQNLDEWSIYTLNQTITRSSHGKIHSKMVCVFDIFYPLCFFCDTSNINDTNLASKDLQEKTIYVLRCNLLQN